MQWIPAAERGISIYVEGFKIEQGTRAGLYSGVLKNNQTLSLLNDCNVFQAKTYAIEKAVSFLLNSAVEYGKAAILVDCQADSKTVGSKIVKSWIVWKCRATLASLSHTNVTLVKCGSGVPNNEAHN